MILPMTQLPFPQKSLWEQGKEHQVGVVGCEMLQHECLCSMGACVLMGMMEMWREGG